VSVRSATLCLCREAQHIFNWLQKERKAAKLNDPRCTVVSYIGTEYFHSF
jgi:hypothetical protein